jgi:ribose/xylose/arabinose/galactoside ABC-type transport system permease subunit
MVRLKAFRVTLGLALIAIGIVLACIPDDWIETASGWSPDNGNGLAEAALAGVPITAGCLLAADVLFSAFRRALASPIARRLAIWR